MIFGLLIRILLIINFLLYHLILNLDKLNLVHQMEFMFKYQERIAEDVVVMVSVTHLMDNAIVILDGKVQIVLNKFQNNVQMIVMDLVYVKMIILVFVMLDIPLINQLVVVLLALIQLIMYVKIRVDLLVVICSVEINYANNNKVLQMIVRYFAKRELVSNQNSNVQIIVEDKVHVKVIRLVNVT